MPFMPYELEQRDLEAIVRSPAVAQAGTVIVPWASDYAFLRFTYPQLAVGLAMSALPGSRYESPVLGPISKPDQGWAGTAHYVGTPAALAIAPRPWVYVGWTYNPVMLQVRRIVGRFGLQVLADPAKTGWHDHLTGSWIWLDTTLTKRQVGQQGQYLVFQLLPVAHPDGRTSMTSSPASTNTRSSGAGNTGARPVKLPNAGSTAPREVSQKQGRRSR
jgi:hypothetical protein